MKSLHIYIIRCTLLVAMLFTVSWAHAQNEEIFAVEQGQAITPNQPITATQSIVVTPGNDTEWPTNMSMGSSWDNPLVFTASTYYPSSTTTYTFVNSLRGTNNPKDGELQSDGTNVGNGYKYNQKNLPVSGGFLVFEAKQNGSLIVPIRVFANKPLYVTDGNGKVKTDIQFKDASGTTYTLLTTTLCAVSETEDVTGFVSFNVTQGEKYYVFCTGSKARFGGYVFSTESINIDPATMKDVKDILDAEPYAVLSENNTELIFYYDSQKDIRGGMSVVDHGWSQYASSITKVKFDSTFVNYYPTSTREWFNGCSDLTSIVGMENLKLDRATDMSHMFSGCSALTEIDVTGFNTANVTDMSWMFGECRNLSSLDVRQFNTANVTDMSGMFYYCEKLSVIDVSNFNTDKVTNMWDLFCGCQSLTSVDVTHFNTSEVTEMSYMFAGLSITTLDLSSFNTSKVESMSRMFQESEKLKTIYVGSGWTINALRKDGSGADLWLFNGCKSLVGGAGTVYDGNHIDSEYARIDNAPDAPGYFTDKNAPAANPEPYVVLSENNTVMTFFYDDQKTAKGGMSVADRGWSQYASSITKVQFDSTFVNYYPTSTREWFNGCSNLTSVVDMKYLKLDRTTDMSGMFLACTSLTSLDVSGFNTQQVTNMQDMFRACTNLTSLDLSKFNTQNVTEMYGMFYNCTNLKSLDLSNFDTRNVRNMDHLFRFCTNLVNLNISGFSTANGASQRNMFEGCSSLASIQAGNAVIPDSIYAQIQNPNLLLYVNEASQAPQSVRNVVVGDVAEQIVLTDTVGNNNFFCPKQFTAKSISYTHNFRQTTQVGVSRGWETIALPFAVQTITHEKNGTLTPFGVEGGKPFWLKELTENGLVSAQRIDAYVPYLISMPNNSIYPDDYNQAGQVTFSATNAVVPVTESRETSGNNRTLIPTMMSVAQSPDIYVINRDTTYQNNPQGSIFVADYREVRPFEAYVKHVGGARYFSLSEIPQLDVTGIESIELQPWKGEQWWTLDGRKLNRRPSKKGIYIRNGKKVVVDATF